MVTKHPSPPKIILPLRSFIGRTPEPLFTTKHPTIYCWVLQSLILFDPVGDPNNVAWFLMGDFLRFSPWSGGLGRQIQKKKIFLDLFGVENAIWLLGFWSCRVLYREKILQLHILYYSLIIMKSLQLRRCRQITEPRKYCLMRVIVFFLWRVFSLFFFFLFLTGWEFGLIPYKGLANCTKNLEKNIITIQNAI